VFAESRVDLLLASQSDQQAKRHPYDFFLPSPAPVCLR
jgi:hypothetical protein